MSSITSSTPPTLPPCKGVFYRLTREAYSGGYGDIVFRVRFRPQARLSCKGCPQCDFIMGEDLSLLFEQFIDGNTDINPRGVNGTLYELRIVNVSTDWETGYVDNYDLEFEEVKT